MYGRIYNPEMGTYPPRGALAISYDPQPIGDRPVGLGFPHRSGRFPTGGSPFLSPGYRSFTCMEGFIIRRWEPVLPGVRWFYVRFPANQRSANGAGVSTPFGAVYDRGITALSPGCRNCTCMEGFLIRGWENILPGVRWFYVRFTANQRSSSGAGVSTPCGAISDRGITVFVPRLSEL